MGVTAYGVTSPVLFALVKGQPDRPSSRLLQLLPSFTGF